MPNHRMLSGIQASGGIGRMNSSSGSTAERKRGNQPIARPSGTPIQRGGADRKQHAVEAVEDVGEQDAAMQQVRRRGDDRGRWWQHHVELRIDPLSEDADELPDDDERGEQPEMRHRASARRQRGRGRRQHRRRELATIAGSLLRSCARRQASAHEVPRAPGSLAVAERYAPTSDAVDSRLERLALERPRLLELARFGKRCGTVSASAAP